MNPELNEQLNNIILKYYLRVCYEHTLLSNGVSLNRFYASDKSIAKYFDGRLQEEDPGLCALIKERFDIAEDIDQKVNTLAEVDDARDVLANIYQELVALSEEQPESESLKKAQRNFISLNLAYQAIQQKNPVYQDLLAQQLLLLNSKYEVVKRGERGALELYDNLHDSEPNLFLGQLIATLEAVNAKYAEILEVEREKNMRFLLSQVGNNIVMINNDYGVLELLPKDWQQRLSKEIADSGKDIGLMIVPVAGEEPMQVAKMKAEKLKDEGKLALVIVGDVLDLPEAINARVKEIEAVGHWTLELPGHDHKLPIGKTAQQLQKQLEEGIYHNVDLITLRACHMADAFAEAAPGINPELIADKAPDDFIEEVGFEVLNPAIRGATRFVLHSADELKSQGKQQPYVIIITGSNPTCRVISNDKVQDVVLSKRFIGLSEKTTKEQIDKNQNLSLELRSAIYRAAPNLIFNDRFCRGQRELIQRYHQDKSSLSPDEKALLKQFYAPTQTLGIQHRARIPAALKLAAQQGTGRDVPLKSYVHAVQPSADLLHLVPIGINIRGNVSKIGPGKIKS